MMKRTSWLIGGALLAGVLCWTGFTQASPAENNSPVTLRLYNPGGGFEVTQTFAPRLVTLNGATICEVSDVTWEADRTFPLIAGLLQAQFPTLKVVSWDQFPTGVFGMDTDNIGELAKAKGCRAAIVGNAG